MSLVLGLAGLYVKLAASPGGGVAVRTVMKREFTPVLGGVPESVTAAVTLKVPEPPKTWEVESPTEIAPSPKSHPTP